MSREKLSADEKDKLIGIYVNGRTLKCHLSRAFNFCGFCTALLHAANIKHADANSLQQQQQQHNLVCCCVNSVYMYGVRILPRNSMNSNLPGGWRRLHNEELHNLYASPNIVRVIKSKLWLENLKRKGHSEDLGVGGMIMLE
jgi:DNA-binding PucR family transcriptional regulator